MSERGEAGTMMAPKQALNRARPNTGVADSFLQRDSLLVCCGEDYGELRAALSAAHDEEPMATHQYRCYRFDLFKDFTLAWGGIGTGCVEPLLYEILPAGRWKRTILVGTAGALKPSALGESKFISEAVHALTPFSLNGSASEKPTIPYAGPGGTILSSDFYYGFSPLASEPLERLRAAFPLLVERFGKLSRQADYIDMETAQFYALCRLYGRDGLKFGAFKGAANRVEHPEQQTIYSPPTLEDAIRKGLKVLMG